MNMTKKLAFLTALLLTFNVSASNDCNSSSASSLTTDEHIPEWSRTHIIPQYVVVNGPLPRSILHFATLSRNPHFIRITCGDEFGLFLNRKTPSITFKAGETRFGLNPLEDCTLNFTLSQEEFYQRLFNAFQVEMF